jgi:hypothetical protein
MSKTGKIIQIVLLVAIIAAAINAYLYLRERRTSLAEPKKQEVVLDPDYYVTPKKLHPQDLKDAKELTRQPAWIREGYRFTYYPYAGHADYQHPAGTLGPIEKFDIKDVVVDRAPDSGSDKQVVAVFEKDGKRFALPIGLVAKGDYTIYSDDILFIQDPHELYKHWPAEVWKLIEAHQVQPGMNELQASFAIGMGKPEGSGMSNPRILNYPNNGHPLRVTYTDGKASQVQPGS